MTTETSAATTSGFHFINDVWGGLASMLVALPSSIAFGVLVFSAISPEMAGQGALVGMIGAAALGLVAPFAGGTPALITAPCAPAAAVLSGLAITLAAGQVQIERIPGLLALTALLSAFFQALYGLLKGGQLIKYIPYPVVSGYLSGVGLIIALGQLPKLLGLPSETGLLHGLQSPGLWKWPGVIVGIVTIIVMLSAGRLTKTIPAAILALVSGVACYLILGLFDRSLLTIESNPLVIGPIRSSTPFLQNVGDRFGSLLTIQLDDLKLVIYSALALSVLLSIDTLKTGVVLGALTRTRHNSNRELFGQGVANLASFVAGGMPGAGTMGPTLVNVTSGGRKSRSGFIEGVFVVLAILFLSPLIAWVPIGALAGILLVVAFRMFDWQAFGLLKNAETRLDFVVIAAVVIVAETVGLISASATGIGLAILLFIRDQIRGSVLRRRATLKEISSKTSRLQSERAILDENGEDAAVYELQGNLFFGTTDNLFTELEPDLKVRKWVLLDMRRVQSMDYTAAHLFEQIHERLQECGGGLLFSGMPSSLSSRQDLHRYMQKVGLIGEEGGEIRIFEIRDDALDWMETRILESAGWTRKEETSALDLDQIELFRGCDDDVLGKLRECIYERTVRAGENVFLHGDEGDEIFLLRRGVVRILLPLKGGKLHHLATFGRGDFFGEMAFLDRGKRSADAEAKTDCELYVLSREEFDKHALKDAVLGVRVFERVARAISLHLRHTDTEVRALEDR
ncbi:MAG: SLC26A/SulP transporter family protein [Acidobacteria bacterium]|nr:SLC26A/SulP transporter family protein [Acidobacteriota bacterium]